MKILINWIGPWEDKGEAAMLISMNKIFNEHFEKPDIIAIEPYNALKEIDIEKYGKYNITVYSEMFSSIFPLIKKTNKYIRNFFLQLLIISPPFIFLSCKYSLWLIIYKMFKIDFKVLIKDCSDAVNAYKKADWIIVCGGQNLIIDLSFETVIILYMLNFSKILKKPVMIWANSFGEFDKSIMKYLIKFSLNNIDLITTREEISKKMLEKINITTPIVATTDAAFYLDAISPDEALKLINSETTLLDNHSKVGISVIPWRFNKDINGNDSLSQNYINSIAKVADYLIEKHDAQIIFFPQVIYFAKDDRKASIKVFNEIANKSNVSILMKDYSPEQLKGMYGCMDFFVGTRFHSCILAQSIFVPTIAIEYEGHKAEGIMKLLQMEEFVCNINNITPEELILKIEKLIENYDGIKEKLHFNIPKMELKCKENIELAKLYLNFNKNK